jgi:RNA polymerase sigma-70 factor (ECF subfamily)
VRSETEDWERTLGDLRPLLVMLARQNLNPRLWKDVDPSGVVQDSLVEASRSREQFRGEGESALRAWVRQILLRNLYDAIRRVHRERRDVDREVALGAAIEESTGRVKNQLSGAEPSPSEAAMKREDLLALAAALERLEPGQRDAVELHHLQGRPLSEAAALMGRSESAVAALLHRGLVRLKALVPRGER